MSLRHRSAVRASVPLPLRRPLYRQPVLGQQRSEWRQFLARQDKLKDTVTEGIRNIVAQRGEELIPGACAPDPQPVGTAKGSRQSRHVDWRITDALEPSGKKRLLAR